MKDFDYEADISLQKGMFRFIEYYREFYKREVK